MIILFRRTSGGELLFHQPCRTLEEERSIEAVLPRSLSKKQKLSSFEIIGLLASLALASVPLCEHYCAYLLRGGRGRPALLLNRRKT